MPSRSSRTSPAPRPQATALFSPEDVIAFRLHPLGYIGPASSLPSSTPPFTNYASPAPGTATASTIPPSIPTSLPSLPGTSPRVTTQHPHSKVVGGDAQSRHAASYPAPHKRTAAGKGKGQEEGGLEGVHAIQVPCASAPRVYAALVPAPLGPRSPAENTALANTSATGGGAATTATGALPGVSTSLLSGDAASSAAVSRHCPAPSTEDIPPPNLRPSEAEELARWTHCAAVRDVSATVNSSSSKTTYKTTVSATALLPVETEVLHHWWRDRLTVRRLHRHAKAVFHDLTLVLNNAVRSTLTAEEAYWQQQRLEMHARGIMSGVQANTFVPAEKMEPLMRAVQVVLHQATISFVEAQIRLAATSTPLLKEHRSDAADESGDEGEDGSVGESDDLPHTERAEVLDAALLAERELFEEIKMASSAMTTPSVITLPPESLIPPPVLSIETAVSATLLARIIGQAEPNTPGMAYANHLLHHYILPHVYLDYPAWMAVRPQMGSLSEQVAHLSTIPLRVQQQRDVAVATAQAQDDARYLEAVVKGWTMRSWLRHMTSERQRVAQCAALERAFSHLQNQLRLLRDFTQWRRRTHRRQRQRQESGMEAAYHQFLTGSQATVGFDGVAKHPFGASITGMLTWTSPPALPAPLSTGSVSVTTVAAQGRSSTNSAHLASNCNVSAHSNHASQSAKKKMPGHSRVYISFMREKSSTSSPSPSTAEAAAEDTERNAREVERFVLRNYDSDVDEEDKDDAETRMVADEDEFSRTHREYGPTSRRMNSNLYDRNSLMYLEAPRHTDDVAFPTFAEVDGRLALAAGHTEREIAATTAAAPPTLFTTMMAKLQEMETVNAYLRRELSVQSRRLRKVEIDNNGLRQRNTELEEGTLRLVQEKLEACKTVQQCNTIITEKNRQLRLLRSRLRAHRHRPWQQAVMRLVGDVCAVSTAASERTDEARVRQDRFGTSEVDKNQRSGEGVGALNGFDDCTTASEGGDRGKQRQAAASSTLVSVIPSSPIDTPSEEERLFGRIAPIVLHSTKQLPDARIILADWANSCLDDLQRLDDINGGPLSARFRSFSEETRNGVLFSRLLYYLALPRYRAQTSAADASLDVPKGNSMMDEQEESQDESGNWTRMDPRRQLLEQCGVQLDPPYPVYEDCFRDILARPPVERMLQLLAFATELMTSPAGDPANLTQNPYQMEEIAAAMSTTAIPFNASINALKDKATVAKKAGSTPLNKGLVGATASNVSPSMTTLGAQQSTAPAFPLPLHSVVDPYALARGESSVVITFIALLYVRFAHPFHHKSRRCAAQERRMLLHLWSNGDATAKELATPMKNASKSEDSLFMSLQMEEAASGAREEAFSESGSPHIPSASGKDDKAAETTEPFSLEAEMLRQLAPEDKTPWQLFRECCLPVFGTQAHPFLLRGGFWPAEAFDTPELAAMLGALAMAFHRSLELHRWHVTLSCLVPVRTYSGLSRGIFTGPGASAAALELALRQDGQEWLCLDFPLVRRRIHARQKLFQSTAAATAEVHDPPVSSPLQELPSESPFAATITLHEPGPVPDEIRELLDAITGVWQEDLLSLFNQRASLSPQLALPVLDLGSWRLLCGDLGLIDLTSLDAKDVDRNGDPRESQQRFTPSTSSAHSTMKQRALEIDIVTMIFQKAVMAVAQERDEVDPAVFGATLPRKMPSQQDDQLYKSLSLEYAVDGPTSASKPQRTSPDASDRMPVPEIQIDMTYASFVLALALLADALYPSVFSPQAASSPRRSPSHGDDSNAATTNKKDGAAAALDPTAAAPTVAPQYCSLPMAFAEMMRCVVLSSPLIYLYPNDPRSILRRLTSGLPTQMVLHRHAPALLLVYQAYSRDVFGEEGLLREDMLRLLRDAMLTSAEMSQYLVFDLFSNCAVMRQANEEAAASVRRGIDGRIRPDAAAVAARKPGYRAVRIVDPGTSSDNSAAAAAQRKWTHILTFEGFCDLVCVLCSFKQPNVFVPFEERLALFLRSSLLRPLTHTVPGLNALLAQSHSGHGAPSKDASPNPEAPPPAHATRSAR
ncbi:hypothetical protein ABL78_6545 [Leptomonas seymouri]|uniref:Uncharacterized protein n=1 Tax=Leptomonas seymouri TaxID=5684 RepID=A0A0N1I370_LEPSE|nr:hypothetical protein ABL78_6545 [Leptomonas seymouri]|eukprot:KPI84401.1 hypothetical protein ABL78_6545 [Leptomonas seymouri]